MAETCPSYWEEVGCKRKPSETENALLCEMEHVNDP